MDAVQFGFFKIAVDMERAAVDNRQHGLAGRDELIDPGSAVVDVAINRAAHDGAIQIELRAVHGDFGFSQG